MKTMLFSTLLGMIILSSLVLAAGSISITSVTIPSSVSVGDSFTITMSVSGSQIQSNQATGSLTLPSAITCDKGSQTINLGAGGTGSTSWTCSASVAGDYTNQITASVTGTDSGTGGSLSDSQQTGLNVLSPASLTVSSTISALTMTAGSSVTFTVGVNNAGGQSTTYNITFSSSPSGLTFSGNVSTTTISGSTLSNSAITVTGSTIGDYTLTATVRGGNGQTLTTNKSLTISAAGSTTTTVSSSSDGGGGGGGTTPTEKKKSKSWDKITPGSAEIMHVDDPDIGLKMINITVRNPAQTVTITVTKLAGQPATVIHTISGKVYKYMEIKGDNINETHIDKVKIQFQVNKSWISSNNVNRATIALNRYKNDNWEKLTTKEVSEDNDYVYYEAETPGFSTFAVTGEQVTTTVATTVVATTVTTVAGVTTTISPIPTELGIPIWVPIVIILIIVIVIVGLIFGRGKSKTREKDIREKFTLLEF